MAIVVNSKFKLLHEEVAKEYLADGLPLLLKFDEAVEGDVPAFKGHLIVDALGTKANTRVTVMQAQGFKGFGSIDEALAGSDRSPRLVKGDIVAFSNAYAHEGVARVGSISARTHDGQRGRVQVLTAMVRPSQSKVSKKGAYQSLVIADPRSAVIARSYDEVHTAFSLTDKEWPGGARGFIIRDVQGGTGDFFEEKDAGIDFLIDELRLADTFVQTGDALELIPAWRVQMGREQVARDINPRQETPKAVSGKFTVQFEAKSFRGQGFQPCLVVACDEEEWAFGGKTGKLIRVAAGVQPLFKREALPTDRLPSAIRQYGGKVNGIQTLYTDVEMDALAEERVSRRGPDTTVAPLGRSRPNENDGMPAPKMVVMGRR